MKRFEAFYKEDAKNNHLLKDGEIYATEVRFDIIAESENRAIELIEEEGESPNDFIIEETVYNKSQMGKDFPEGIRDARI